jgi:hypothetical protein
MLVGVGVDATHCGMVGHEDTLNRHHDNVLGIEYWRVAWRLTEKGRSATSESEKLRASAMSVSGRRNVKRLTVSARRSARRPIAPVGGNANEPSGSEERGSRRGEGPLN